MDIYCVYIGSYNYIAIDNENNLFLSSCIYGQNEQFVTDLCKKLLLQIKIRYLSKFKPIFN